MFKFMHYGGMHYNWKLVDEPYDREIDCSLFIKSGDMQYYGSTTLFVRYGKVNFPFTSDLNLDGEQILDQYGLVRGDDYSTI